jgi:hypothetical protein
MSSLEQFQKSSQGPPVKFHLAIAFLYIAIGQAAAQSNPQSAAAILAANHAATGELPQIGTAQWDYDYSGSGLTGSRTDRVDLATGAFVETVQAGAISEASGYDGKVPWMRDLSGANTPEEGGDRVQLAVNEAYRRANLWWRPDAGAAGIVYQGRETEEGATLDHLTITPPRGKRFDAWFDADSHLLARIAEDQAFLHTRTTYADYRREGDALFPHKVLFDGGTGEASHETLQLARFGVGVARSLDDYSRPREAPAGGSIENGAASVTVPFRFLNHHIYITARVNGKGPYTFMVDTGGHTLLSPHLVTQVGLKPVGAAAMSGAGEGSSVSGFAHVDEIALGALRLRDQMGFTTEIYDPAIEGIIVDGMVGFELFRRFAVQIDYGLHTLTFTDPARFDPRGTGTAIPFKFYDHLPMIEGRIGELPARFDIDTGSRSEITITGPFVALHQLRSRFSKGVNAVTGWGVGGPSRSYAVRLPSVSLGGVQVEDAIGDLSADHGGSMSDANYDGNIGSGLLQRFVVTFDYAHQLLYLKPLAPAPIDAGRFDRSGLWINAGPKGYVVADVAPGGPAEHAGIAVGDIITSIEGKRCPAEDLANARLQFRARPAGSEINLTLERGTARKTATLILRDQV